MADAGACGYGSDDSEEVASIGDAVCSLGNGSGGSIGVSARKHSRDSQWRQVCSHDADGVWPYTIGFGQWDVGRACSHSRHVGNDDNGMADIMLHGFRRSADSRWHDRWHHSTIHKDSERQNIDCCLDGAIWSDAECYNLRPIYQHIAYGKRVSRHI